MNGACTATKPCRILLVEDNPGDVGLIRYALEDARAPHVMTVAEDGEKALTILHVAEAGNGERLPDLILLDLNLPRKSGLEVLSAIKSDEHLRKIPVIVLTSSRKEEDIATAYDRHANCYIVKPVELDRFMETGRAIEVFWSRIVTLPDM
jgi:chemotaxis family two-component system response regulator Rcp1